jgi:hypothetical protein
LPFASATNLSRSATGKIVITCSLPPTANSAKPLSAVSPAAASDRVGTPSFFWSSACISLSGPASSGTAFMNASMSCHECSNIPTARGDTTMPITWPSGASGASAHSASRSAVDAGARGVGTEDDDDDSLWHAATNTTSTRAFRIRGL